MDGLLAFLRATAGIEDVKLQAIDPGREFDCLEGWNSAVKDIVITRCVCVRQVSVNVFYITATDQQLTTTSEEDNAILIVVIKSRWTLLN